MMNEEQRDLECLMQDASILLNPRSSGKTKTVIDTLIAENASLKAEVEVQRTLLTKVQYHLRHVRDTMAVDNHPPDEMRTRRISASTDLIDEVGAALQEGGE